MDEEDKAFHWGGVDAEGVRLSQSLVKLLTHELENIEGFRNTLLPSYDKLAYENMEWMFNRVRNKFKTILTDISNSYYSYINRSEAKIKAVNKIISYATSVAESFQLARENERLDRPEAISRIDNLVDSIKNLIYLCDESIHGDPTTRPTPPKPTPPKPPKKDKYVH